VQWKVVNGTGASALNLTNAGRIVLAATPSTPSTLFASIANVTNGNLLGVYKTTDSGAHWTQLSVADYCTPQCSYDNVVAVDPANANVVYAGGAYSTTLSRSLDGGNTWSVLQSAENGGFLHADMHALTFTPDGKTLYLGNDGGVYNTTQITTAKPTFTGLNPTLAVTQFYPGLTIDPANPAIAIGGTQDNGTDLYSGKLTWEDVTCGDGSYTAIDTSNPNTMYAACNRIDVEKSTSSGKFGSWSTMESGIDTSDRVDFIPPMVMDPEAPQTLYFGTYRIYQTTNGASSWTAISPDLTNGPAFWGVVTPIAVAPSNRNVVYAGTGDSNVQVTFNPGAGASATWTKVASGLPPRIISALAVNPTHPATAFVTFSGFSGFGDSLGHVFMTTDSGANWTDVSGNLPNTPVNAIVINSSNPNQVFIATDTGVYYTDNESTWTLLATNLPHVAVLGLTLHAASETLLAATHGRGVWDLHIAGLP
jgi:photosystem II stability/assembly factor-like uncharacterized protein